MLNLNQRAGILCDQLASFGAVRHLLSCGTTVYDCGVEAPGGIEAGLLLARICLADLATVELMASDDAVWPGQAIRVATDQPVAACMASQYAGWEIKCDGYFAMGSGPMRAAAGREPLFQEPPFDEIARLESPIACVGVLESGKLPPEEVCLDIAAKCGIEPAQLTLLVASTSSPAGTLQVVARSVETAMHKLHELGFDLSRIESGFGVAPLPPVAEDDLTAIGRTNDAILYGGQVTLRVRGDDASLEEMGPQVPSSASADYGRPFAEVLARYDNDFYKIDPLLFSAAEITLENIDTGTMHPFGKVNRDILEQSFKASGR